MGFTVYFKGLHTVKKESHRLTVAKCTTYNISLTSVNWILKYYLQQKCMLVRCGHRLPGSSFIVEVSSIFFIRVFSAINGPSFLRKHLTEACSPIPLLSNIF